MSKKENDKWLDAAVENFTENLDARDFESCRSIINDVRDKGFEQDAIAMEKSLAAKMTMGFVPFGMLASNVLNDLRTEEQLKEAESAISELYLTLKKSRKILSRVEVAKVLHEALDGDVELLKNLL